ncbi:hypothetical protein B9Z55_023530 [Caenorhabditis nigoni]|uniref:Uncharacterized protein n=1 Tax=Caenorhabditis nigoni TaxID=1611254 RepID=A0A2G5SQK7_9PELO|nr:hypothetical protein B9Z55_023530 [Caenorhabditis nigoni]
MEKSVAASSTSSNASSTAEATLSNPEAHTSVTSNSEATTSSDSIATSVKQKNLNHLLQKERQPTFPKKISAIALTSQIETIASYSDLKSIEKKASLAIEKMNKTGDKTIPFKNFNLLIGSMIVCLEENRIGFHQIYSPSVSPVH